MEGAVMAMNTPAAYDYPPFDSSARRERFARFAAFVLAFNVFIILWGAYVRATGSGAGCGNHWPLCDGQYIPPPTDIKRMIEFGHRVTSALDGFFVLILLVGAFQVFERGHGVRLAAIGVFGFTGAEALIGRSLVKNGWVVDNISVGRAVMMSLHLANTFLLLTALVLVVWWARGKPAMKWRGQGVVGLALAMGLLGALVLGVSGAITALGDTLFPVKSGTTAWDVFVQSLNPAEHFLVRLRVLHPLIAVSVGLYLLLLAGLMVHLRPSPDVKRYAHALSGIFLFEIVVGLVNRQLAAPVSLQLFHLLVADLVWVSLVLLTASAVAADVPQVELSPIHSPHVHEAVGTATWKDYLALTKPRVISLLLFTTIMAMFIAQEGFPGTGLLLWVGIGGYMAAGAANAINMVIDRDIDGRMKRTAKRPTVTQTISSRNALLFGFALAFGSFIILWSAANLPAALLALAGLVFYVIIYTLLLKRRTWQNIVIGGAAGAFPPLVGWAAVTGNLSLLAWYLFAIVFVWTPVHFWALALLLKEDYAEVGVPMLPVVKGDRVTVQQIGIYTLITVVVSLLPFVQHQAQMIYLVGAIVLNGVLLKMYWGLVRQTDRPHASALFHYSMLYLALLFAFLAADRSLMPKKIPPQAGISVRQGVTYAVPKIVI
jgi:heme o synthase